MMSVMLDGCRGIYSNTYTPDEHGAESKLEYYYKAEIMCVPLALSIKSASLDYCDRLPTSSHVICPYSCPYLVIVLTP
jgi:uncharacterized lipoprotein YehR (DUF1307 family)